LQFVPNLEHVTKDCDQDQYDVYSFAYGNRQFLNCRRSLREFAMHCFNIDSIRNQLNLAQQNLITYKVLQNLNWQLSGELLELGGKKKILTELRGIYALLYRAVWGNKS